MNRSHRIALLLFLLAPCSSAAAQEASEIGSMEGRIALLRAWVRAHRIDRKAPGYALAVVQRSQILWAGGFGQADLRTGRAMTADTRLPVGSMAKIAVAAAVLQLRDKGGFGLDDPAQRLARSVHLPRHPRASRPVTVRDLLSHSSGIPREAPFPYWTDNRFPSRETVLETLPTLKPLYPPGQEWMYSNLGYAVLGEILREHTGLPPGALLKASVFGPLGMTRTALDPDPQENDPLAMGYRRPERDGSRPQRPAPRFKGMAPALGLVSTARDLARLGGVFLDGKKHPAVLAPASRREMMRLERARSNVDEAWGLGFALWPLGDTMVAGHEGYLAGYGGVIALDRTTGLGVVVLSNADDADPGAVANLALTLLAPAALHPERMAPPVEADPSWRSYLGRYRSPLLSWYGEVFLMDGRLTLYSCEFPPSRDPMATLVQFEPVGGREFVMRGPAGNGEPVEFFVDDQGRVVRARMGDNFVVPLVGED